MLKWRERKNDDHKCLPTIIKLRIFIVNNQSLKLNDKQKQNKKHSKINLLRDKSNQTLKRNKKKKQQTKPTLQNQTVKLANNLEILWVPQGPSIKWQCRETLVLVTNLPTIANTRKSHTNTQKQLHHRKTRTEVHVHRLLEWGEVNFKFTNGSVLVIWQS